MWPSWLQRKNHSLPNSPRSPRVNNNFTISSFKDIEYLANDEISASQSKSHLPNHKSPFILQRAMSSGKELRLWAHLNNLAAAAAASLSQSGSSPPNGNNAIVLYFTSLHVVRRTYEDCRSVRSIFQSYCVDIDERDLSMDCKYIGELHELMKCIRKKITLPVVFIRGEYIGGVEEIKQLDESGEMSRLIEGLPRRGGDNLMVGPNGGSCDQCGGLQFVVCGECSGSHKIYVKNLGAFRSCTACNANGLVKCSACSPVFLRCKSTYA
ncbi:hypothetical protein ACFE04_031025 [Oxalis oulophora]